VSYDLYLIPEAFDGEAIHAWFAGRGRYRDNQYTNDDTGVYFMINVQADAEEDEDPEALKAPYVGISINYFRPRTFALEAEREVAAFLARFPSRIHDPQRMGDGPYSREGFLEGWDYGNRVTVGVMRERGVERPATADSARLEAVWDWNYRRAGLQAEAGEHLFVPKIVWVVPTPGADPEPAVTWTFGVATIIPESLITRVVLVRQERPKLLKLLARNSDPKFEYKLINAEGGIRIAGIERGEIDGRPALFTPQTGPLEMQALFSGAWSRPQFRLLQPEFVLDRDLVEAA
jgi:hypothetical protein